jgi:hypothetical protein
MQIHRHLKSPKENHLTKDPAIDGIKGYIFLENFMFALWVLLGFLSTSAFACPYLAGQYKECRSTTGHSSGSYDMVVSQIVQNKITTYTVTATDAHTHERLTEIYRADGKINISEYKEPDSGILVKTTTTVFCDEQELNIKGQIIKFEKVASSFHIRVTKYGQQQIISSVYADGEDQKTDQEICE